MNKWLVIVENWRAFGLFATSGEAQEWAAKHWPVATAKGCILIIDYENVNKG